jgi:hypothetical protein
VLRLEARCATAQLGFGTEPFEDVQLLTHGHDRGKLAVAANAI